MKKDAFREQVVIITGASAGIGKGAYSAPFPVFSRNSFRLLHGGTGQVVGAQAARSFPRLRAGLRWLATFRSLVG